VNINREENIILALPKGRILSDLMPLLKKLAIEIESEFLQANTRKLLFSTNISFLKVIICRSYDIATLVSYGAADLGIAGLDVIEEFQYNNLTITNDLNIGKCKFSVAGKSNFNFYEKENLIVATKYPNLTKSFFSNINKKIETIKLNGSIELAVNLGLCDVIADLVSSGKTLKENNLVEKEVILNITSKLIANNNSIVTNNKQMLDIIKRFTNE
jgi:ATP phosphoribosyltransferase